MKKPLEFQVHEPGKLELIQPVRPSNRTPFQDLLLKHEYTGCKYTLPKGSSSFRLLPAIKGSPNWMQKVTALDHCNGRHTHPKSLRPDAPPSVFDLAEQWLKQHQPQALWSKSNPNGYKLWGGQVAACWVLVDAPQVPKLGILIASTFGGSKQVPVAGLGYQIQDMVRKNPELLDPDEGSQITVTRSYEPGSKYPHTHLVWNQTNRSLNECLGDLSAEDLKLVCPIQDTIRQIEFDREWMLLSRVIGSELTEKIRDATAGGS